MPTIVAHIEEIIFWHLHIDKFIFRNKIIIFQAVIDTIVSVLKTGEKIQIPGFGSFEVVSKSATTKINPLTFNLCYTYFNIIKGF